MALTSSTASLIRSGKTEAALRLLEHRMASSVSQAGKLTDSGVRLPPETPNLREAAKRAAKYASENNLPQVAATANEISSKLE